MRPSIYKSTTSSVAITVFQHLASGWAYWTDFESLTPARLDSGDRENPADTRPELTQIAFGVTRVRKRHV